MSRCKGAFQDELIATCILLLNAGHEAAVNVIGNGMLALLRHPDQLQMLKDNPALIETAVEEISFGNGLHYCLGAPLARLELQTAISTLLRRMPNLQLDGDEPEYRDTYVIRALKALPVTF